ncbi:MAG: C10 family peptidase [Planctomycetes bacterium]|nr:C10 family peptidase [Planctomycetota bacterium]
MKSTVLYITLLLITSQFFCVGAEARPTTAEEAAIAVRGWLSTRPRPLGTRLSRDIICVEAFANETGDILYYIVSLDPSGFVIVPSDDRIEPIMGFAQNGTYDPSPDNPLAALLINDVNRRLSIATILDQQTSLNTVAIDLATTETDGQQTDTQRKWHRLIEGATAFPAEVRLMSVTTGQIDDLRVAPLVKTRWDQTTCWMETTDVKGTHMVDSGVACYNFYTPPSDPGDPCDYLLPAEYSGVPGTYGDPNNYPSGCVATAMAQVMRYYEWPRDGIGKQEFNIQVKYGDQWQSEKAWTRGGDGNGGPYDWENMLASPVCGDPTQCKAIGALCYDAGISVGMQYSPEGSSASTVDAPSAFINSFNYMNAIVGLNVQDSNTVNIGASLMEMINPNLDAGKPVILAIKGLHNSQQSDHAVVCDGYGFDSSAIYHHLNMGGSKFPQDCEAIWYQLILPDISHYCKWCQCAEDDPNCQYPECWEADWSYDTVLTCVYNIFPEDFGEIVSGRVLDASSRPVPGITVFAKSNTDPNDLLSDETGPNGIFAFTGCQSETEYTVDVNSVDANYPILRVRTLTSINRTSNVGNVWNLELRDMRPLYVPDDHPAIQEAVDATADGQVVIVRSGTYTGNSNRDIDFRGKAITLASESGAEACIIDCQGSPEEHHRGFYFHTDETRSSIVEGITIVNGFHNMGGAIYCTGGSDPTIRSCVFSNNTAVSKGGAFYNNVSNPKIIACKFNNNTAGIPDGSTGEGGAIYNSGSGPNIICSVFTNNSAQNSGGAVYSDSTRICSICRPERICARRDPVTGRCTLWIWSLCPPIPRCYESCYWDRDKNRMHCITICPPIPTTCHDQVSRPTLRNCTFVGNTSTNGAALDFASGSMTLENCIVWDNSPEQVKGGATVSYSNVQGGLIGDSNIDVDPLFVDPDNGDYHLQVNSPCVNTGYPHSDIDPFEIDLDGNPRITNGNVDMGAYEF